MPGDERAQPLVRAVEPDRQHFAAQRDAETGESGAVSFQRRDDLGRGVSWRARKGSEAGHQNDAARRSPAQSDRGLGKVLASCHRSGTLARDRGSSILESSVDRGDVRTKVGLTRPGPLARFLAGGGSRPEPRPNRIVRHESAERPRDRGGHRPAPRQAQTRTLRCGRAFQDRDRALFVAYGRADEGGRYVPGHARRGEAGCGAYPGDLARIAGLDRQGTRDRPRDRARSRRRVAGDHRPRSRRSQGRTHPRREAAAPEGRSRDRLRLRRRTSSSTSGNRWGDTPTHSPSRPAITRAGSSCAKSGTRSAAASWSARATTSTPRGTPLWMSRTSMVAPETCFC